MDPDLEILKHSSALQNGAFFTMWLILWKNWSYTCISEGAGVEFPTFQLTCVVILKTLWHYRASMW